MSFASKPEGADVHIKDIRDLKDVLAGVNQSAIRDLDACKRLFLLKHRWGLVPKFLLQSSSASRCGSIVHRLMQVGPARAEDVKQEVQAEQRQLMVPVEAGEDPFGQFAQAANSLTAEWDKALAVCKIFWETFPANPDLEDVAVEQFMESSVTVGEYTIKLYGTPDRVQHDKRTDYYWLRDYKSTSLSLEMHRVGDTYSLQSGIYRLLVLATLSLRTVGFIYDRIRTPGIKYCKKDASFEAYLQRVRQWYLDSGEESMLSHSVIFKYPTALYPELEYYLCMAGYFTALELTPDLFPRDMTGSACKRFNKVCPYYDLCQSDPSQWPGALNGNYIINERKNNEPETKTKPV